MGGGEGPAGPLLVQVAYLGLLPQLIKTRGEVVTFSDQATLRDLLNHLKARWGRAFETAVFDLRGNLSNLTRLTVNGCEVQDCQCQQVLLREGDEVAITLSVAPMAGGERGA